ncbi:MAG: ribokinase [Propionibacteriaceae bacterium]|nr:ribokinase [Propionibacteriaceae bacterium]
MAKLVVVGSINLDDTVRVHALPAPGETVLATDRWKGLGGKGANQAVAAALAGAEAQFFGCVGDDAHGTFLRESLAGFGVGERHLRKVPGSVSGRAIIMVDDQGENSIVVDAGANEQVTTDGLAELLASADAVLMQGELPARVVDEVSAMCEDAGVRFLLNLAPPIAVSQRTLRLADPLIVNQTEARALGVDAEEFPSRSLVLTLGAKGALAVGPDGSTQIPAYKVEAVDTTGAGDAFVGTFTAALAAGADFAQAAHQASAAAAYSVTRPGTSPSYGTPEEIAAALKL